MKCCNGEMEAFNVLGLLEQGFAGCMNVFLIRFYIFGEWAKISTVWLFYFLLTSNLVITKASMSASDV